MTAATTEHFALRAALNRYWWLLLGRHKLSLVCNYVTAHRQQLLPLPWPEQEFLQLDPAPPSHLPRHTFATMSLSKGVPMESVSKMLGHTNIKTTQIYARITNKKIEHDMEQLAGKLDKFNVAMGINSK